MLADLFTLLVDDLLLFLSVFLSLRKLLLKLGWRWACLILLQFISQLGKLLHLVYDVLGEPCVLSGDVRQQFVFLMVICCQRVSVEVHADLGSWVYQVQIFELLLSLLGFLDNIGENIFGF